MADGSVLEPRTLEKSWSSGGQLDLDSSSLPESSSLENGNSASTTVVVDVPGTKYHLDTKPTTFEVRPPLPSGLLDVEALRGHFSSFGGLSNVKLVNLEAQDDNHTSSDRKTIHNFSALASFVSRHAAEDAFRDGRHWNGHDLQFAWVHHRSRETSPDSREHRNDLVRPETAGNLFHCGDNPSSAQELERRETSPPLKDSSSSGVHQSAAKSDCSVVLEEYATTGALEGEEEESYIELAEADYDSETSPVGISAGK